MAIEYQWYEGVNNGEILQGDILKEFEVLVPVESEVVENLTLSSKIEIYDVIILTQSCDLENGKTKFVLLCPLVSLDEFDKTAPDFFKGRKGKEQIRNGLIPNLHMIDACNIEGMERPISIVYFNDIFSMPVKYVIDKARKSTPRLRLLPPYREHLSQSFARFFMRVGLPTQIPRF